jgi:hypothetical protein
LLIGASNISVLAVRIKIRQAVPVVTSRIYSSKYSMAEERFALVFWIEDEHILADKVEEKRLKICFHKLVRSNHFEIIW